MFVRLQQKQFVERFSKLDALCSKVTLLENPFDSVIENLPTDLHMKVIDLQPSEIFKDTVNEGNIIEFRLQYDQNVVSQLVYGHFVYDTSPKMFI